MRKLFHCLANSCNKAIFTWWLMAVLLSSGWSTSLWANGDTLRMATFDIDATPPAGTDLAYGTALNQWDLGLRARGIVLMGAGKPIVLCSMDWIGIANESHDAFCAALAKAAHTTPDRVAVHTVHPHDTPLCDFGAEKMMKEAGLNPGKYDGTFPRKLLSELAEAVSRAVENPVVITKAGYGEAEVKEVASNRRVMGTDGKVRAERLTWNTGSDLRAEPEGLIDPVVSVISLWNGNAPVAILSYYAVHPQSYYRTGITNPDFTGVARFLRQLAVPEALHLHFNGAAGNVATSKYNDNAKENRGIFAHRLADGMKRAWENTVTFPLTPGDVSWQTEKVLLPPAKYLENLTKTNWSPDSLLVRSYPGRIAWYDRCLSGHKINISCLTLAKIRILHLPGEPFVEFQLAAKAERRDLKVAVAGYGDYGPGYIGTSDAYGQGGYETGIASNVAPEAGFALMEAIRKLLHP